MNAPVLHLIMPKWVPPAVRQYVHRFENTWAQCLREEAGNNADAFVDELRRRLATMKRLTTEKDMQVVWQRLEKRGVSDEALRRFFETASFARDYIPLRTEKEQAELVSEYCSTAKLLRKRGFIHEANYFEWLAQNLERAILVKNQTKNDDVRAYVLMLAKETQRLFGGPLSDTVAIVATVALGRNIDERQVRNWCIGLNKITLPT